ncbi:hypothetical protein EX895_003212 [Sporisorium graminicola]|uniref:Uncharacterized protein n=1 Tax=Sporisorium graminicola TaxID=280036 RepID=A0A4U7KT11_9BASI|nr:hypothetical protein EX895_003212 [Sporisorium graminicola]TKY87631.1 hypothetical protein EX895_003212 [Sporisorium graminicola]
MPALRRTARRGSVLELISDQHVGQPIWRVQPAHVPSLNQAESHKHTKLQSYWRTQPATIEQETRGIRLTNSGTSARIFVLNNSEHAYYVPGKTSSLVDHVGVSNLDVDRATIHKVPASTEVKTSAYDEGRLGTSLD